ncbi:MAG: DinB family protein [Planctomycetaceae bacterium]
MSDPTIDAARETFERSVADLIETVRGLPADALNWRPARQDTNAIAVLATHAAASANTWLAVATGAPAPDRDRDAEFRTVATSDTDLLASVDGYAQRCLALLDAAGPFEPDAPRTTSRRATGDDPEVVSAAWALLHALEHLREHVGQASLTRQLWEQQA